MGRSVVNLLSQLSLLVGGSLVSSTNGLPTIAANDTTASGSVTGNGQSVATISTNGKSTATIGLSGTWSGTVQVEVNDGTAWVPQRVHFTDTSGAPSVLVSITANGTVRVACAGYSQVRVTSTAWVSGTLTVTARASGGVGAAVALIAAMGIVGTAAPNSAVAMGVKDGSNNLQLVTLGQALAAACLPVVIPTAQDVVNYAGSGGKILTTETSASTISTNTGRIPAQGVAAVASSMPIVVGLPSITQASTWPTAGQSVKSGAGSAISVTLYNSTGGAIYMMAFDATSTRGNGSIPSWCSASISTGALQSFSIGSIMYGLPVTNGLWVQFSSTNTTMTTIASTAIQVDSLTYL